MRKTKRKKTMTRVNRVQTKIDIFLNEECLFVNGLLYKIVKCCFFSLKTITIRLGMPYYRSNLAFCCYGTSNLSKIVSFVNVTSKRVFKQFLSEENFNKAKTFPPKQICQVLSIFKDDFFSSFFCPRYLKCWSVQFLKLSYWMMWRLLVLSTNWKVVISMDMFGSVPF